MFGRMLRLWHLLGLPIGSLVLVWLVTPAGVHAQRGRGQAPPATNPRAAAPIDLTGYWVSIIVDEWRFRVTPQKGDIAYLPLNPEARKVANAWDPSKDESEGGSVHKQLRQRSPGVAAAGTLPKPWETT